MKVGIVGAGAIGTLAGFALAAHHDVRVLVRTADAATAIEAAGGLLVDGEPARPVRAAGAGRDWGDVAVVLVAVKTPATLEALTPLRGVLGPDVALVSLQNGGGAAERIDAALGGRHPVALGPTTAAARLLRSGHVRRIAAGATVIGWQAGRGGRSAMLEALAAALTAAGLPASVADPIEPHVWAKLVAGAAILPVTALAGVANGAVLERPELRARAARLAREVAAVAAASGIALPFSDPVAYAESVARATAANRSSMRNDLDCGAETEIDAVAGSVVRRAARVGVPVPELARAYDEVRARTKA